MILETNHGENNNIKDLSVIHEIKAENIDVNAYFLSVTDNAFDLGLLSEEDMSIIQAQIYGILSDNIRLYTNGASDSVMSSEANELMLAILHALDSFCVSQAGNPIINEHKLIDLIKIFKEKGGIINSYQKGLEFINKKSAKEIAAEKIANEMHDTLESFENLYDYDEFIEFENEINSSDNKANIISQSVMTDEDFNWLYNNILKCRTAEKKAGLIIKSISSAGDFLDILNAQCLFGDEYLVLYQKLSEESPETIGFLINNLETASGEQDEWQEYLTKFLD